MKQFLHNAAVIVIMMLAHTSGTRAQNSWAMVTWENGQDKPAVSQYRCFLEKGTNGKEYYRINDVSFMVNKEPYNPVELQYGYRMDDMGIYIYDYKNDKETPAFDFSLTEGDSFTTYNGMEWKVESVKDTLVDMSIFGTGEYVAKRLINVISIDGRFTDQWLEGFGSFANHFMIKEMDNIKCSQTLWMEYEMGEYIAREISADPLFAHDSGWMNGTYDDSDDEAPNPYSVCKYEDGKVIFESKQWWYKHRDYSCFYRSGDDIYQLYAWEMQPQLDSAESKQMKDVMVFEGLPDPESGSYNLHIDDDDYTTSISKNIATGMNKEGYFDLQGKRMAGSMGVLPAGTYLVNGKKVVKQ